METTRLTLRTALAFVVTHPGCTVNDLLAAHGMELNQNLSTETYLDYEYTGAALLDWLSANHYVTYEVTSWDGWKYTAIKTEI